MFDGLRKKLAKAASEDEEIIFRPYEDKPQDQPEPEDLPQEPAPQPQKEAPAPADESSNIELKVVRPVTFEDVSGIADYLIEGCTVVLNLELLDKPTTLRMLDFLNGVTYVKDGEIKNVAPNTYIVTPSGIDVND